MLSEEEEHLFNETFALIQNEIKEATNKCCSQFSNDFDEMLKYNVLSGKKIRAKMVIAVHTVLSKEEHCNEIKKQKVRIVAWCIELMQAHALVIDDIMDSSLTRRGRVCWYRLHPNVAIMQAACLRSFFYSILYKYCKNEKNYHKIVELCLEVEQKTTLGQAMDALSSITPKRSPPTLHDFTHSHYAVLAKLKTSFYTTIFPVRLAMYLANIDDHDSHELAQRILSKVGILFQAQDDYLDVFGDRSMTGKIGTDIQDGKCTWIAVEAITRMDSQQLTVFKKNYGINDPVAIKSVENIYATLDMKHVFEEFETTEYNSILKEIEAVQSQYPKLSLVMKQIVTTLVKRTC